MFKIDKKIIFLVFGRIIQSVLAIISIRLLINFLPQEEIGRQYLLNSVLLWFSLVLINPVGMYINRHIHEWKANKQLHCQLTQINKYFFSIAVISLPIIFIIKNSFSFGDFLSYTEILIFVFMYIYFSTWFQTIVSLFNLLGSQKVFVSLNILAQALGLFLAVLGVHAIANHALMWLSGLLIGQIVALVAALYLFYKHFPKSEFGKKPEKNEFFTMSTVHFCIPIAITTLFMWFMNQGYRLVVDKIMGVEVLATLGVGLGLAASIASVVESITTQYFYPGYYSALTKSSLEDRKIAWEQLFERTLMVYLPCAVLILSVSQLVVRVLTSVNFYNVVPFVCLGAAIELFRQLSNISYLVSHSEKKTKNTIMPYFLGSMIIAVSLFFLTFFNIVSSNNILYSLVFSGLVTCFYNYIVVKRLIGAAFNFKLVFQSIILSLPLLVPLFISTVYDSLFKLFALGVFSGVWCLLIIYLMLNRKNYFFKSS